MQGLLDFYRENGPGYFCRDFVGQVGANYGIYSSFNIEGYLTMLVGNKVPYEKRYTPTPEEWQRWRAHQAALRQQTANALTVEEALAVIRHPGWRWNLETQ